jgi:putative phage-type endonuclease
MNILDAIQGSPEWHAARAGSLGASQVADAIAKTKAGYGASRANLRARLVAERLTGQPQDTFSNAAMDWGREKEAEARAAYAFLHDRDVVEIGIALHPAITGTHASPDGLVADDGLVEIKCPNTSTHIDALKSKCVPGKYVTQMQWQMACTGRAWCDFVSYDPRLPIEMQVFVTRIARDDALIGNLETEVRTFLAEVDADVLALSNEYQKDAA